MLPKKTKGDRELVRPSPVRVPHPAKPVKPRKGKRRKSRLKRWGDIFEDAFDVIEDIFD